jgi:hypothetical protein
MQSEIDVFYSGFEEIGLKLRRVVLGSIVGFTLEEENTSW